MKKLYLLILIVVSFAGAVWSQPVFEIDNTTGDPGGTVAVNFKVRNFNNIVGMQFSIDWDPTILKFSSLSNITNAIRDFDAASFNTDSKFTDAGNVILTWFDTGAEPNTLPDGTIIFTINFDIVGGSGSTTTVAITDTPRKIEIIDNNEEDIGLSSSGGLFTASGNGGGATLRLIGSDEVGGTGENVCVEVTVQGFTNINGMQFSLNWDPAFLRYTGVGAFNLNGLTEGTFNTDDASNGKLGLQWLDPSSSGITLADGTRIFQICFDILGSGGSRSVQFTNDPVAIEIIDGDDMRVTFAKKDGTVTVEGGGGSDCDAPGFALAASEESASQGSQTCVDISVKGFTTVTSLSGTIEWNPAVLSNPSISAINLEGLAEANFNLDQGANGIASFVWIDPSTDGITLSDGAKIFEICFDVIGGNGQSTEIRFTDAMVEREVTIGGAAAEFNQCDGQVTVGNGSNPVSASVTPPGCRGDSDGAINITVSGGTSPYTYQWTRNGANFATSEDLNNIAAGTYVVTVTDADGTQFSLEVIVNNPAGVTITNANLTNPTGGGADGSIALTVSGGATPLQFAWSNGATTRDIAGLSGGTYSLTITESNGCTLDTSFALGSGELALELDIDDIRCFGDANGQVTALASGGVAPYSYTWSVAGQTGMSISALGPGSYSVTVTDADGTNQSASGTVAEPEQLQVTVNTTPSPNNIEGTATAVVSGGTAPYSYAWTDANRSTTRVVIGLPQGNIRVLVNDSNNCQAAADANIGESDRECYTAVPVMSPNGDGRNDFLNIACAMGLENELEVYDRHGQLVFEATNYANDWSGIDLNGDQLPDGAYYWVIRVRKDGILEQHLGHLTILAALN